jgi:hypothetical protein
MEPAAFLGALFGDSVSEEREIVLFAADQGCHWQKSVGDAVAALEGLGREQDVWFGVALQGRAAALEEASRRAQKAGRAAPGIGHVRGFARTARAIGGLWCDLDVAGEGHAKHHLPPDLAAIGSLLDALPARRTWTIATGGGVHAWWRFNEPWLLDSDDDRRHAARLAFGWQGVVRAAVTARGWVMDSTHDLARVMRIPGTRSKKHGGFLVTDFGEEGPAWEPDDFETWLPQGAETPSLEPPEQLANGVVLNPNLLPGPKLAMMLASDEKFAATWNRKRKDLPSQSEHDQSLASIAVRSGFTDQEVVSLIMLHREIGGADPKARPGYYANTLKLARSKDDAERAAVRIVQRSLGIDDTPAAATAAPEAAPATPAADGAVHPATTAPGAEGTPAAEAEPDDVSDATPSERHAAFMADLSAMIGKPGDVVKILRYVGDPPTYRLILRQGSIDLGEVATILDCRRFRTAVAAACGQIMALRREPQWTPIAQQILNACEDVLLGPDSDPKELALEWLRGYLADHPPAESRMDGIRNDTAWIEAGTLYFRLPDMRRHLALAMSETVSRKALGRMLRQAGVKPRSVRGGADVIHFWAVRASAVFSDTLKATK